MKTGLVTGAAGGMGSAICKKLTDEGCQVFAVDIQTIQNESYDSVICDMTDLIPLKKRRKNFKKISAVGCYSACGGNL